MIANKKALEMKMLEKDYTYKKLAEEMQISMTALHNKVNSSVDFKLRETQDISDILKLSQQEYITIFIPKFSSTQY